MGLLGGLRCSIDLCVCLCQYQAVLVTVALQCSLIAESVLPLTLFFLKTAIRGLLWFHTHFWSILLYEVQCWYFDRNCTESVACFGQYGHFNDVDSF